MRSITTALAGGFLAAASFFVPTAPASAAAAPGRAAILAELRDTSAAGISRRLGPDYKAYKHPADEAFPSIYILPQKQDKGGQPYQLGGPWTKDAGDYSSTQGQVLYVPDDPAAIGVDRVTIIEWAHGCFTEAPLAPWWGGFRPEPATKKWAQVAGGYPGVPVSMARGMGSWANMGVLVFSSGLIATAGTATGRGFEPTAQLAPGLVPTAVSVTNKNEFALITCVDPERRKGLVAVLAIGVNGKTTKFVHEWQDDVWSLPNVASMTAIKVLGYVEVPGMEFPTSICAVGNREGGRMNGRDGNAGLLREYDLAKQADRDVFLKGSNAAYGSSTGWAVVASKHEDKAAFIDLQPLFARVREAYFTTEEQFQKTRDAGLGPKQWPPTFDADPSWKPPFVSIIDVPRPTAVIASMSGGAEKARAMIASEDGTVGLYTVGGLATDAPADPADIRRVAEANVGRNPTCLAYQKYSRDKVIAVSRGDRAVSWLQYGKDGLKVIRTMRDANLIDPVFVEQSDTHGIEGPIMTVVDFAGKKVANYRWGTLTFATQGGAKFGLGADGKADFECGGVLTFPGHPFCVSATNVN